MAVELAVKLSSQVIRRAQLYDELVNILSHLHVKNSDALKLSPVSKDIIGGREDFFCVSLGDDAEVECMCHCAGSEEELGYEGGWWLSITVTIRSMQSKLLLLALSACVSKLVKTPILDESNLFAKSGRFLAYEEALQILELSAFKSINLPRLDEHL